MPDYNLLCKEKEIRKYYLHVKFGEVCVPLELIANEEIGIHCRGCYKGRHKLTLL